VTLLKYNFKKRWMTTILTWTFVSSLCLRPKTRDYIVQRQGDHATHIHTHTHTHTHVHIYTDILLVPRSRLVTVGGRSFPVTGPQTGNNLPAPVRSAPSLLSFKRQLKHVYFHVLIPEIVFPNSLVQAFLALNNYSLVLLIQHNQVDFCVLKLY